ncbi:histidine kinase [Dokdonia pacifica]|uniref:histidine kinase n=1 Tax=Dokdonia pacifica TaxID=1627892 RepID=A0A238WDE1_9FLAO|nr:response regulator [Dokdonia pacifica]GGG20475.1 histidine kinase [Dokdonia pacifica]SNR44590.1 Signal transduction histidine kinase [Dokdonia pacifica]
MKCNLCYIILFCLCANHTFAQEKSISEISQDSIYSLSFLVYNSIDNLEYKNAIEIATQIIAEGEKQQNPYYVFMGYDLMGSINSEMKDTIQARLNHEKALKIVKETKQDSLLSWAYLSLGNVESDGKKNYQKGIDYYKKSIELNTEGNEFENIPPLLNIAWTYLDENKANEALPYLLQVEKLYQKDTIYPVEVAETKTLLGRYHTQKGNYALAGEVFKEVEVILKTEKYPSVALEFYKYYGELSEMQGNYEKAYQLLKKAKELDDKKYEQDKLREVQAAKTRFNIKEYERTIASARNEQIINDKLIEKSRDLRNIFIIASTILLIALIAIFFAFKSRKKYIKRLHEKNNQLMVAKDNAERLSQLKTQFFSTVSHELRTPLYGVIGLTSILLEDETSKNKEDLKSLKFSADYLMALINDVLLLNKMDADGITLEKTSYRLSSLAKSITRSFEFSLEQNNNKIHLHIDENIPDKQIGDYVRLSQILMNLIGNAIKFNENGNIWVSIDLLEKTKTGLYKTQFTIKDDGIGIPVSKQKTIFEEFSQVENRNYNYQGTGLGLPIVKKLLALYESEVILKSEMGKGSIFTFTIDLEANISDESEARKNLENEGTAIHVFENVHILVVDDNRINQKITQKILEKRQFKCSLADDGEQAIALVKENTYDLILMDIHMPKVDGVEATKEIRKFNTEVPIVALTAVELDEMRATIMNSGMNDIILKPYDISQFLTTILRNLNKAFAKSR